MQACRRSTANPVEAARVDEAQITIGDVYGAREGEGGAQLLQPVLQRALASNPAAWLSAKLCNAASSIGDVSAPSAAAYYCAG